jgi:hypothetical protein
MGLGDRVLETFGVENEDGDLVLPGDVGGCPFCGFIGHGFNDHTCPKCKERPPYPSKGEQEKFIEELETGAPTQAQLESLKRGRRTAWNNKDIRGHIGERWFANKLRNEAYLVRQTMFYDYGQNASVFNREGIKDLLKDHLNKRKVLKLLSSLGRGYPDLICLKDNDISFYEIKTNDSEVKEHQKQSMEILEKAGYLVYLKRLQVDFNVTEIESTTMDR